MFGFTNFTRQESQQRASVRTKPVNAAMQRTLRTAMVLAALAAGVSCAVLMSQQSALATPLACPVPDGTIVSGNDSIEGVSGICRIGNTVIQSGGQLDNNLTLGGTASIDRFRTLENSGTLNNNQHFAVVGTLNNEAAGTFNNNGSVGSGIAFVAVGGTVNNAGTFNNRSTFGVVRDSAGTNATLENTGTLNSTADGVIFNGSNIVNQAGGIVTHDGVLNNGSDINGIVTGASFENRGVLSNGGVLNHDAPVSNQIQNRFDNHGQIDNTGTLNVRALGFTNHAGGSIGNSGALNTVPGGGPVSNFGTIENRNGGVLNLPFVLQNGFGLNFESALLTNRSGGTIDGAEIPGSNRGIENAGVIVNESGGLITGTQFNNGSTGKVYNGGTVTADGTLVNFDNFGTFVNRSGGTFEGNFLSMSSNSGSSIVNEAGALFDVTTDNRFLNVAADASFRNEGNLRVGQTSGIFGFAGDPNNTGDFSQLGGSTVVNGTLALNTVSFQGGSVSGSGTISAFSGPVSVVGASVNPGNSPGTLSIEGDGLDCFACSINIEVAGLGVGEFDLLDIEGLARFFPVVGAPNPSIEIAFIDGFAPQSGDMFNFLTAGGGISGFDLLDFSIVGLPDGLEFDVSLTPDGSALNFLAFTTIGSGDGGDNKLPPVASVSEPATGGLLGLGLAALGWLRRRKRQQAMAA